ncbi:MAG: hypothetical protein KBD63_06970 [Bacteriovoracaceae bacterium]|nr:hypothetical protein [Bacteriovoracaceae bacterium]
MPSAMLYQIQSTLILAIFYLGFFFRRQKTKHIRLMLTAIIWDLLLILQIELNRGAIAKAMQTLKNPWILNIHVSFAISTTLLYFFLIYFGRRLAGGDGSVRPLHRKLGMITLTLRTLTYITSYFIVTGA